MNPIILRRRRLGMTSCREISNLSTTGIRAVRYDRGVPDTDLVFRWGCTANVPTNNVVNTALAIHEVNDKRTSRLQLSELSLAPKSWGNLEEMRNYFIDTSDTGDIDTPVILRPRIHSRGRNIFKADTFREAYNFVHTRLRPAGRYYISEYIDKVAEYRVFIVQGRVACVAQKIPGNPNDLAWNVARGGKFENVRWDNWPLKAVRISVEAFNEFSLDFGGVDVMVDNGGNCYVLEINSAPSLTSPYRQQCMAKCFDYIVENGKQHIPLIEERGGYRKFIHPAVSDRAILV